MDLAMLMRPGRLKLKRAHLFISRFIFSIILLTAVSVMLSSLLTSNPNIRAFPFISNPRSTMSWSIASILPIGTNTVFSMLQQSPDRVPNFSKTSFTLFRVRGHSFMMIVASSAMAATLG